MINLAPDVVIYRAGCINDFQAVADAGAAATAAATATTNATTIINRFLAAGIRVIIVGTYGYGGSVGNPYTGDPASIRLALMTVAANLAALAAANPAALQFVSMVGTICDASGNFLSTNYYGSSGTDVGVHLSGYGQYTAAPLEAAALTNWFGPAAATRYRGVNYYADPLFKKTTSISFGTIASGLAVTAVSGTRQNAKIETINGKVFQTCELAITAANNTMQFQIPFNPTAAGLNPSVGDIYGFEVDVYNIGLASYTPNLNAETIRLDVRDTAGAGRFVLDLGAAAYAYQIPAAMTRHVVFPPLKFGDKGGNLTTASVWSIIMGTSDASGTYKMGIANPRIIRLSPPAVMQ